MIIAVSPEPVTVPGREQVLRMRICLLTLIIVLTLSGLLRRGTFQTRSRVRALSETPGFYGAQTKENASLFSTRMPVTPLRLSPPPRGGS